VKRVWTLSGVLIVLTVLVMACAGSTPTPTPFQTEFPSAPDCPGFAIEREVILRSIREPGLINPNDFRCTPDGFSASRPLPPGHNYGVSIKRYDTVEQAEAALGTPNSTFHNSPAVHLWEFRHPGEKEYLTWQKSRWVFGAGRFDDTSAMTNLYTTSLRMYEAAVDLGLITAATSPPSVTAPAPSDSPIVFVMKDRYALGEPIEIRIRNNGNASFLYDWVSGCPTLKVYGPGGSRRVHRSTHCDVIITKVIRPQEEIVLATWHQSECFGDIYRCVASCQVKPSRYGVAEQFYSSNRQWKTQVEWTFLIGSPIDPQQPGRITFVIITSQWVLR